MPYQYRKANIAFTNAAGDVEVLEGLEKIGTCSYRRGGADGRQSTYYRERMPGRLLLEFPPVTGRKTEGPFLAPRQLGRIVSIELQPEPEVQP